MKVGIIMGSISDRELSDKAEKILREFGVSVYKEVISAHRTPERAVEFAENCRKDGFDVIIAIAGKAAHLGGVLAAITTVPVIGLPAKSSTMDGLDSLLSIVQMPKGIPVATVAINGAENAALLAVGMMSLKYDSLVEKLDAYRRELKNQVKKMNEELQS
ncbi:MAG: 5-(carboxyamino)imidazole ribonucleotide mutase [Tissierellia bacterium]|nr:5-(carboxyamino)imidazole ribonucleotide mutase [Tissierellia bacterium]